MTTERMSRVLVTGASGFIAGHCVQALLDDGYAVRGTVRSLANEGKIRHLRELRGPAGNGVDLVEADLNQDAGWREAVSGCEYVLHVASPFPSSIPDDESELIVPAVEGTRRVLAACAATQRQPTRVRRVVLTSSLAAVAYGHRSRAERVLTEADWSDPEGCEPYQKSKTLAERAAWDFVASLPKDGAFELTVINPGFVLGPMMSAVGGTSAELIKRLLNRGMPACPEVGWAVVDVRDLARAHLLAMTAPAAAGNRYICAGDHMWLREMAQVLASEFNPHGYRVPTGRLPYWVLWLVARFDKTMKLTLATVGKRELVSHEKSTRDLGWVPRPPQQTLVAMGYSAIELGLVPDKIGQRKAATTLGGGVTPGARRPAQDAHTSPQ